MEELEKMEAKDVQVTSSSSPVMDLMKSAGKAIMSDTPKWAKIVRLAALGLTAIGATISTANPLLVPTIAFLIPYGGYITLAGTLSATFVQFFTKKE